VYIKCPAKKSNSVALSSLSFHDASIPALRLTCSNLYILARSQAISVSQAGPPTFYRAAVPTSAATATGQKTTEPASENLWLMVALMVRTWRNIQWLRSTKTETNNFATIKLVVCSMVMRKYRAVFGVSVAQFMPVHKSDPPSHSCLRHCFTSRKFGGSIPDYVFGICYWLNPSGRTIALGSSQPVTEISTRNISGG
jgi:hypothetical protein